MNAPRRGPAVATPGASDGARADRPGRLNVLMVNTYQTGGGAGRAAQLLARALRGQGHAVRAIVAANLDADPFARRADHWREAPLSAWLARRGFTDLGRVSSFLWPCRDDFAAADVLHWHNLHGDYLSLAAAPLWGRLKPVVWTLHDFWPLTGNCAAPGHCDRWRRGCGRCPLVGAYPMGPVDRTWFYRRLKPRLLAAARPVLVTPSRWLAERVGEVPALARLPRRVIPNAVDSQTFRPRGERGALRERLGLRRDVPTVVLTGHTWEDPLKGGAHAVAALRRAAALRPELQVLIVGHGSARLLAQLERPGRALPFLTDRATLADAYACADACLFPSLAENHPLTTLEALACGVPVVAYAVGGIPEQFVHGRHGYLARAARPEALAAGLGALLSDLDAARRMGDAGRKLIRRTADVDAVARQYVRTYALALRAWRRRWAQSCARRPRGGLARFVARMMGWEGASGSQIDVRRSSRRGRSLVVPGRSRTASPATRPAALLQSAEPA